MRSFRDSPQGYGASKITCGNSSSVRRKSERSLAHGGDIRKRDLFEFSEADAEVQGGHAFRVLAAYERWLGGSKDGERQLAVLRLLGLFDRPADPGCLAALRAKPAISGLTDALVDLSDAQWNIAIKRLEEIGLVQPLPFEATVVKGYGEKQGREALARDQRGVGMDLPEPEVFRPTSSLTCCFSSTV